MSVHVKIYGFPLPHPYTNPDWVNILLGCLVNRGFPKFHLSHLTDVCF